MPAEMAVIKRVPIAQVGTWAASTGEWEATRKQFEDAVRASQDRSVRPARIYLGHNEERIAAGTDTTPAVGWPSNLALDGDTLYADLWVPPLLAETAHVHFPGRSIEARTNVTASSGQRYAMVLDGVALLGRDMPAVDTLPDLAELWGMNDRAPVAASAETSGSRLIVCALTDATPASTAGPVNQRPEGTMPNDATDTTAAADTSTTAAVETTSTTTGAEAESTDTTTTTDAVTDAQDTTSSGLVIPEGFELVESGTLAEMKAQLAEVPGLVAAQRKTEAAEYLDNLVNVKRSIAASSVPDLTKRYMKDPEGTRAFCDLMPEGIFQPPPVGRVAATRANDDDGDGDQGGSGFSTRLLSPEQIADAKARGLIKED